MVIKNRNNGNGPVIRVGRTAEGTAFEAAVAVLTIVMWGLIAWMWHHVPETIPTHFDITGQPDGYGDRSDLIIMGVVATAVSVLLCTGAYRPTSSLNIPVRMRSAAQYAAGIRLMRIIALITAQMFVLIVLFIGFQGTAVGRFAGPAVAVSAVMMFAVIAFYTVKIYRMRSR